MLGNLDRTKEITHRSVVFYRDIRLTRYVGCDLTNVTSDHPGRNFEDIGTETLALRRAGEHGYDHIPDRVLRHQNPNLDSGPRTNQKLG
jgi:hypothetical protein